MQSIRRTSQHTYFRRSATAYRRIVQPHPKSHAHEVRGSASCCKLYSSAYSTFQFVALRPCMLFIVPPPDSVVICLTQSPSHCSNQNSPIFYFFSVLRERFHGRRIACDRCGRRPWRFMKTLYISAGTLLRNHTLRSDYAYFSKFNRNSCEAMFLRKPTPFWGHSVGIFSCIRISTSANYLEFQPITKTICIRDVVPVHTVVSTVKEHVAFITELEFFNAYESPRQYCGHSKVSRALVLQNKLDVPEPVLVGILAKFSPNIFTIHHWTGPADDHDFYRMRHPNLPGVSAHLNSALLRVRYGFKIIHAKCDKRHG